MVLASSTQSKISKQQNAVCSKENVVVAEVSRLSRSKKIEMLTNMLSYLPVL